MAQLRKGLLLAAAALCCGAPARAADISYNRDVRPILSDNCFMCHGPDKAARKAGLRLDIAEDALADHGGARPIVPGNADASAIIQRIVSTDPDEVMPPHDSGKALTPAQIDTLRRWVNAGAQYEAHWAYIPPSGTAVPAVNNTHWPRNPIDNFVLRALEDRGLSPSPEADRATLVRRLSLDLAGLPPATAEIDAWLADERRDAYDHLVDRLLASPQFGERMAVDWLDIVRYADTNGYHGDEYRAVYPYRDYVINAFNANKPYDQFTIEQLAGDLLPNRTREQIIAATYNRLNQITAEGGSQAKEYIEKYAADRVRTASTAWLGSTFACAQCHDHKYDPISMRDFYSFAAFFADIEEQGVYGAGQRFDPVMELPAPDQEQELARLDSAIADTTRQLETPTEATAAEQRAWEDEVRSALDGERDLWSTARVAAATSANGTVLEVKEDGSVLGSGPAPDKEVFEARVTSDRVYVTGLRIEALTDPSIQRGLARGNGNFVLSGVEIESGGKPVALKAALADYEQANWPVAGVLDADPNTGWAVDGHLDPRQGQARQAVIVFAEPLLLVPGSEVLVRLRHESHVNNHAIGRFRLAFTAEITPRLDRAAELPLEIREIVRLAPEARSSEQAAALTRHFLGIAPSLQPLRDTLNALQEQRAALQRDLPIVLLTRAVAPRTVRVLPRGNWMDESGEVVQPATPSFLPARLESGDARLTRLDLAKWLVSGENPLTARVYMNRLWALYFGTGISKVLDDLGLQGEWPTHPELLDWLAEEFVRSGWDIKHMVRLMVTSNTYRQASLLRRDLDEIDPYNRLLARQARVRLAAEFVRDNALSVSGLLSLKVGGPLARPYQPEGYYNDCNTFTGPLLYETSQGEDQYRRGLYTFWKRSFLHPSMLAFDAPSREECTAMRPVSNTPLQALVLLNDPTYVEAARTFAEVIVREGGPDVPGRIRYAFRRATGRHATEEEAALLAGLHARQLADYAAAPGAAEELFTVGQRPAPQDIPPAELAAWTAVARAILNLHEVITRS